jgi:hypothetical protein
LKRWEDEISGPGVLEKRFTCKALRWLNTFIFLKSDVKSRCFLRGDKKKKLHCVYHDAQTNLTIQTFLTIITDMMNTKKSTNQADNHQKIAVFQQNGSGESKIAGLRKYGAHQFRIEVISIDDPLPPLLEDTSAYLPNTIEADLVLDFLKHPDLSHDLAAHCSRRNIPLIASGKKHDVKGVHTPPT